VGKKASKRQAVSHSVKRIEKYYSIKGDGVAQLKLADAIKSRSFQKSIQNLNDYKLSAS